MELSPIVFFVANSMLYITSLVLLCRLIYYIFRFFLFQLKDSFKSITDCLLRRVG